MAILSKGYLNILYCQATTIKSTKWTTSDKLIHDSTTLSPLGNQ